ncbi:MAG TPA: nitroreductase family protein [Methanolinea sp.]|nr:nitroreductase family protein [Methanolinea sp.]
MATIHVNPDSCTRCGICAIVCPMGIVSAPGEQTLPGVPDAASALCIRCGHCEAYCPAQALLLCDRADEKVWIPQGAGSVNPQDLGIYMRKRRSVRNYRDDPVPAEKVREVLDIARYAATGGCGQPVEWTVVLDRARVRRIAELTIEWLKTLRDSDHPMRGVIPVLVGAWESGRDVICRDAPHLLFAHIPEENPVAFIDAVIALTYFDIAAPAHGIGTCWAGFVAMAAAAHAPLRKEINLPAGRKVAYAMMFGYPRYAVYGIPPRKPLAVTWL